jgi:hypothetical protein
MIASMIIFVLVWLSIVAFAIISQWKVFTKAGQPGWAIFVPIYNFIVILKIVNKPWWWLFLMLIPIVNIVFLIIILHRVSLSFGKSGGFTVGLVLLSIVFWGILAFDKSEYKKLEDAPAAA